MAVLGPHGPGRGSSSGSRLSHGHRHWSLPCAEELGAAPEGPAVGWALSAATDGDTWGSRGFWTDSGGRECVSAWAARTVGPRHGDVVLPGGSEWGEPWLTTSHGFRLLFLHTRPPPEHHPRGALPSHPFPR